MSEQSNSTLLRELIRLNAIAVGPSSLWDTSPVAHGSLDPDRLAGMMLGLAVGDALGNSSEGINPPERSARHGEIRDYLPNRYVDWKAMGTPSDDSQMAFWTLEQLCETGAYDPVRLAQVFSSRRIFGIGSTVRAFVRNHSELGLAWNQSGPRSAGNGALMRIGPMIYPHLRSPSPSLWADVALSTMTTHNDNAAIASSLAFIAVLWDLLHMDKPPSGEWWSDRFCRLVRQVDDGSTYRARGGAYEGREGSFSEYLEGVLEDASRRKLSSLAACEMFHSGAYLLETVPCVLYILQLHAENPEEAIVRAVNDTRDNDTIAAIVGAAVGALHGRQALPRRWLEGLTGRTGEADDGRMFELLDLGKRRFLEA